MLSLSLNHRSRMKREFHVRFCERWGGKFLLPTRPSYRLNAFVYRFLFMITVSPYLGGVSPKTGQLHISFDRLMHQRHQLSILLGLSPYYELDEDKEGKIGQEIQSSNESFIPAIDSRNCHSNTL